MTNSYHSAGEPGFFKTKDLGMAASLLASGFDLLDSYWDKGGRKKVMYFLFEKSPEILEVQSKYKHRKLLYEPRHLLENYQSAKGFLYFNNEHEDKVVWEENE